MTQTASFIGWCGYHHMTMTDINTLLSVWEDANDDDFIGTGWVTGPLHARDVWDTNLEQCVAYTLMEFFDNVDTQSDVTVLSDVQWALNRLAFMTDFNDDLRYWIMTASSNPTFRYEYGVRERLLELFPPTP